MGKHLCPVSVLLAVSLAGCCGVPQTGVPCADAECSNSVAMVADCAVPLAASAPPRLGKAMRMREANGNFKAPAGRQMAFSACLTLRVPDVPQALMAAKKLTEEEKGYIRTLRDDSLALAVPAARAEAVLQKLLKFGTKLSLRIDGEDITEAIQDLELRMENLKKSRARLLALMEQTARVDDLIKVENALTRVTTELERLQTRLKNQKNRVEYVTMSVSFQLAAPKIQQGTVAVSPLRWINELGNITARTVMIENDSAPDSLPFSCVPPAGFVQADSHTLVSGSSCVIALEKIRNAVTDTHWYGNDYAELDFYREMIRRALKERFRTEIRCRECTVDGVKALEFRTEPLLAGQTNCYQLVIAVSGKYLYRLEACGKKSLFKQELKDDIWNKLLDSIEF